MLSGWHGRPPEAGDETTLFLEGKNFSIHDTHVIAGGKPALTVLVSRQLLQVTIPREACPTPSADGTSLLDIAVATPNGASNHLLIRMHSPRSRRGQHYDEKMEALLKEGAVALGNKMPPDPGTLPLHNPKNLGLGQAIAPARPPSAIRLPRSRTMTVPLHVSVQSDDQRLRLGGLRRLGGHSSQTVISFSPTFTLIPPSVISESHTGHF